VVQLTVTKGCYFVDLASGRFQAQHPAVQSDAADPDRPKTVFGLIVAGLHRRREQGVAPFAVLSCDNILHNGVSFFF
jgi:mannitol 2-dehydrogenase